MGYTTAMEAAMPPLFSRHVHEEIRDTPIIDEGAFPVFGNNWFVMEYLKEPRDREHSRILSPGCSVQPKGMQSRS